MDANGLKKRVGVRLGAGEACPLFPTAILDAGLSRGAHRVDNGPLLRADVHIMFDRGYLGVDPQQHTLRVSPKLREVFGNGEEFYGRAGQEIALPGQRVDRTNPEFLEWHLDEVYDRRA